MDLANLFSVYCVIHPSNGNGKNNKTPYSNGSQITDNTNWKALQDYNKKVEKIQAITGFRFPESNTALVFPMETIMSVGPRDGESIIQQSNNLIGKLVSEGIQLDVISPILLKEGHLSPEGLHVQNRIYEAVIFPYPEVLDPAVLETISLMDQFGIPILLGGCKPKFTTKGKRIPHVFPLVFDPQDEDLSPLWDNGLKRMFKLPQGALGTCIHQKRETLFLFAPKKSGGSFSGKVEYKDIAFSIPRSHGLVIFRVDKKGEVEKVL